MRDALFTRISRWSRRSWKHIGLWWFLLGASHAGNGFMVTVHGEVTKAALLAFSDSQISAYDKDQIVRGAKEADYVEGGLPFTESHYKGEFHFDNCKNFREVLANYTLLAGWIDTALKKPRGQWTPYEFGKALHAAEDFYAHSNYVPIFQDLQNERGNPSNDRIPTFDEVMLHPKDNPVFLAKLQSTLRTGVYPFAKWKYPEPTDHGWPAGPGMNKDYILRPRFTEAHQLALLSAVWYLKLYCEDKTTETEWKRFRAFVSVGKR